MKKTIIYLMIVLCVVSCEIYGGEYIRGTGDELSTYTMDAFNGHVMMPVLMTEMAIDFDAYLNLSDEEKKKDFRFYGNIRNPEENHYIIETGNTTCTLKTDGRSVWDEDSQWTFLSFSTMTYLNGRGSLYCSTSEKIVLDSDPVAPGDTSVRLFSMVYGGDPVGMVLCSSSEEGLEWNVGAAGVIKDQKGYTGEYMTGSGGIIVEKRYNEPVKDTEYICSGEFLVTVYRNDEPIDICKAVFRPGVKVEFITGN